MSKKCLLLFAKSSVDKGLANPADLSRLLTEADKGIQASWAYFDDLVYSITNDAVSLFDTRNNCQITDYSVVYFRYWGAQEGHAIGAARICHLLNVPFIDSEVLRVGSQNKVTQYTNLFEAKVPIPRTLIAEGTVLVRHYQDYGFTFPLIVKDKGGTRGQGNYLAKTHEHLEQIIAENPGITFVMQEFIPNDGDYRVLVVGDEVKLLIHRQANNDSHLNNTSQGGSAKIVPIDTLPAKVLDDCVRASRFFARNISGVDIVKAANSDNYYCFEVNRAPQIEHASFEAEKAAVIAAYLASF